MNKVFKHLKTICIHKYYVYKECKACGIIWQGIIHDMSKFNPIEFIPSVKYYQGNKSPTEAEKEAIGYSSAWLHHKGHNKHHWEYWIDYDKNGNIIPAEIPLKYVIEMICDWIGASKTYSDKNTEWIPEFVINHYRANRSGRYFNEKTENLILYYLNILDVRGIKAFHDEARADLDIERRG